jgi:DNA-binding transcriptional LysR family regulator
MLLRQLEYLVAVARERHFGRAAAACHVSQPALSEAIRKLEEELGVRVVQRGRTVEGLTPEGERVLEWAQRMLADRDGLRDDLRSLGGEVVGTVRIGAIPAAMRITADLVARVCATHPRLRVSVLSISSIEIERRMTGFELDAGVTYLDNEPLRNVRSYPVTREQFMLVGGPGLNGRASASWAEAAAMPLCLLTPDMQNRRIVDAAFARAGAAVEAQIETDTVTSLLDLVARGPWVSVVSSEWVGAADGYVAIPLVEPEVAHTIGLVVPDREPLPSTTAALVAEATRAPEGAAGMR